MSMEINIKVHSANYTLIQVATAVKNHLQWGIHQSFPTLSNNDMPHSDKVGVK